MSKITFRTPTEEGRKDAVHVPIIDAKAWVPIEAGQYVKLKKDIGLTDVFVVVPATVHDGHGIANPFGDKNKYNFGEIVRVLLDPKAISNVTHSWEFEEPIGYAADWPGDEDGCCPQESDEDDKALDAICCNV